MQDAMEATGDMNTENDADEVYNQILGEIGMDQASGMATGTSEIKAGAVSAGPEAVSVKSDWTKVIKCRNKY